MKFFKTLQFKIIFLSIVGMMFLQLLIFAYVLPLFEENFLFAQKETVKAATDLAYSVMETESKRVENKEITVEQAKAEAAKIITNMRYNGTDYFFMFDFDGVTTAHGLKADMVGKPRIDAKDPATGNLYVKQMRDFASGPEGQGFVSYFFPKTKDGAPEEKISFVRGHKDWKWFVGTGLYVGDVKEKVAAFKVKLLIAFYSLIFLVGGFATWYGFRLSRQIKDIVTHLHDNATEVNGSVGAVSTAGQNLSGASTAAAASLEETVASLEEITSMIKTNSDNSQLAAQLSQESRDVAKSGEIELNNLTSAMVDISNSSKQISDIIDVIDDIAFQTNLLALNASVEAARAGEQGKGFAVVAEAVRTLAQRSSVAAKDIATLINDSADKVQRGSKAAENSNLVLNKIMQSINKIADLNSEIAAASNEQTTGIQQINSAMNQLDQVSQGNAASSEEIAANVTEISRSIGEVDNKVRELKVLVEGDEAA